MGRWGVRCVSAALRRASRGALARALHQHIPPRMAPRSWESKFAAKYPPSPLSSHPALRNAPQLGVQVCCQVPRRGRARGVSACRCCRRLRPFAGAAEWPHPPRAVEARRQRAGSARPRALDPPFRGFTTTDVQPGATHAAPLASVRRRRRRGPGGHHRRQPGPYAAPRCGGRAARAGVGRPQARAAAGVGCERGARRASVGAGHAAPGALGAGALAVSVGPRGPARHNDGLPGLSFIVPYRCRSVCCPLSPQITISSSGPTGGLRAARHGPKKSYNLHPSPEVMVGSLTGR